MQLRLRRFTLGFLAFALLACAANAQGPAVTTPPATTGEIRVTVTGFKSEKGQALVSLFVSDKGWPNDHDLAFASLALPIQGAQVVATFKDVPAGPFAVSTYHDENGNRKLDTRFFGIPKERYGFSRDARGTFGAPGFEAARLDLAAGDSMSIAIRVH
jgi:uncharacterized protein (DUF2141 family)